MNTEEKEDKFGSIKKGLLEMVVLKIISINKVYAADILEKLKATEFATQEGTLYPLLNRLRREGAVEYEWVESEAGPPRKYYRLTGSGSRQLESLMQYWDRLDSIIKHLS
jgi:PadR family transcriptional regulator PadR